jgi:hypothetical protein
MRNGTACSTCGRDRTYGAAAIVLLIALTAAAQPGKSDLSNVTVLRDIE